MEKILRSNIRYQIECTLLCLFEEVDHFPIIMFQQLCNDIMESQLC